MKTIILKDFKPRKEALRAARRDVELLILNLREGRSLGPLTDPWNHAVP